LTRFNFIAITHNYCCPNWQNTEIDGTIKYGKVKRGIREIHVIGKKKENVYKIPYGKHILVHEGDFVFAGDRLCEGSVSPKDILKIGGVARVQEYLLEKQSLHTSDLQQKQSHLHVPKYVFHKGFYIRFPSFYRSHEFHEYLVLLFHI
jgi:hypothetical protein